MRDPLTSVDDIIIGTKAILDKKAAPMDSDNTNVEAGETSTDALLGQLFRSLGRVLAATGVSIECIENQLSELVGQAASTEVAGQAVHLGGAQRECMELLCLWRREPHFLDQNGFPLPLPLDGRRP
jgi:hypothetical protein